MYLKISAKQWVTAEYWQINTAVSIYSITDKSFEENNTVAEVKFNNQTVTITKQMNAWLVNDEGKILEVINRDYNWS